MPKNELRELEKQTLQYLQFSTREMGQLAKSGRFPFVAYYLDMAYTEVSDVLRGKAAPRPAIVSKHPSQLKPAN